MEAIPKSVKREGEEADRLIKELAESSLRQAEIAKKAEEEKTVTPARRELADTSPEKPALDKPEEKKEPSEKPPEITEETWQQKYLVLQGKYQSEVPQLHIQLAQERNQREQLSSELQSLKDRQEKPAERQKEKEEEQPKPSKESSPDLEKSQKAKSFKEEYQDVYEGTVEVTRILAASIAEKAVEPLKSEIQSLRSDFQKILGRSDLASSSEPASPSPAPTSEPSSRKLGQDKQLFLQFLTERVPDWRSINVDPKFIDHLEKTPDPQDPTRSNLARLNDLYRALDVNGVATYFENWQKLQASNGQGEKKEEKQPPVFPPNSKGGEPPKNEPEPVSNRAIEQFYDEKARGKWKGRETEAATFEQKIMAAASKGLITP